jgi:hypothetical protein
MWTSPAGDRGTTIHRVRLRGAAGLDALAAELRASRAIEQVADGVTLPAGAILCVRHLRDPRPRCVSLSAVHAPPAAWARAVAQALADLAGRAARPAHGPVDGDVEAVIFDDRAQMLACLAADWCGGSIAARWWWRALIGTGSEAEAVLRAWRQHPSHMAAAIEQVARLGFAPAFVRRLPERAIVAMLEAVVAAHGLSRQLTLSEAAASPLPGPLDHVPRTITPRPAGVSSIANAAAVWRRSAPEVYDLPLRTDQQLLLGVALTVRRHPARARDPIFAAEVAHWRCQHAEHLETVVLAPAGFQPTTGSPADMPEVHRPDGATSEREATATTPIDEPPGVSTHLSRPTSSSDVPSAVSGRAEDEVPEDRTWRQVSPDGVTTVDTGLGGMFYLLNVALALGLYGDFTAPRGPRLDLSIWRFIALVGNALLGGRHRRDPLWRLLSALAGPNPRSITGSPEWRLNPAWLAPFPEPRIWRWSAEAARLRVRHPAGFLVLDVRRSSDRPPVQQVRDEIEAYRRVCAFRLVPGTQSRIRTETEPARWVRWHAAYTRARLARALGVSSSRAGTALCRHRARVRLSLTHVDVTFSLASLPIAIRSSGLDRDPGWIPAADRIVSFTYG